MCAKMMMMMMANVVLSFSRYSRLYLTLNELNLRLRLWSLSLFPPAKIAVLQDFGPSSLVGCRAPSILLSFQNGWGEPAG